MTASITRADHPPHYPPITYGEYRVWWLNTNYGAKLDYGKISPQRARGAR
jgi:hypothetical protein